MIGIPAARETPKRQRELGNTGWTVEPTRGILDRFLTQTEQLHMKCAVHETVSWNSTFLS